MDSAAICISSSSDEDEDFENRRKGEDGYKMEKDYSMDGSEEDYDYDDDYDSEKEEEPNKHIAPRSRVHCKYTNFEYSESDEGSTSGDEKSPTPESSIERLRKNVKGKKMGRHMFMAFKKDMFKSNRERALGPNRVLLKAKSRLMKWISKKNLRNKLRDRYKSILSKGRIYNDVAESTLPNTIFLKQLKACQMSTPLAMNIKKEAEKELHSNEGTILLEQEESTINSTTFNNTITNNTTVNNTTQKSAVNNYPAPKRATYRSRSLSPPTKFKNVEQTETVFPKSNRLMLSQQINKHFTFHDETIKNFVESSSVNEELIDKRIDEIQLSLTTLSALLIEAEKNWNRLLHSKTVNEEILVRLVQKKKIIISRKIAKMQAKLPYNDEKCPITIPTNSSFARKRRLASNKEEPKESSALSILKSVLDTSVNEDESFPDPRVMNMLNSFTERNNNESLTTTTIENPVLESKSPRSSQIIFESGKRMKLDTEKDDSMQTNGLHDVSIYRIGEDRYKIIKSNKRTASELSSELCDEHALSKMFANTCFKENRRGSSFYDNSYKRKESSDLKKLPNKFKKRDVSYSSNITMSTNGLKDSPLGHIIANKISLENNGSQSLPSVNIKEGYRLDAHASSDIDEEPAATITINGIEDNIDYDIVPRRHKNRHPQSFVQQMGFDVHTNEFQRENKIWKTNGNKHSSSSENEFENNENSLFQRFSSHGGEKPYCMLCYENPAKFSCGNCENQWYCSATCQSRDWPNHSNSCGALH